MRLLLLLLWCLCFTHTLNAEDLSETYVKKATELIRVHYPDANFNLNQDKTWECLIKPRSFTIYRGNKTGEWQKEGQEIGPDKGGLIVRFMIRHEPLVSALDIPYIETLDLYVFQETHVIKQANDGASFLWVKIDNPRIGGQVELVKQLSDLFNTFK